MTDRGHRITQCNWLTALCVFLAVTLFALSCVAEEGKETEKSSFSDKAVEQAGSKADDDKRQESISEVLTSQDCDKCHDGPSEEIEADGMAHKTEVTCVDCHQGHPPEVRDIIPRCSNCHAGEAHFELDTCLQCHVKPHTPLNIELTKNITGPCLTCHSKQGEQLRNYTSFHSRLACTACHYRHDGQVPTCSRCHRPHSDAMTEADCHLCHMAHMPLIVTYGAETPSETCGVCHGAVFGLLAESPAKHHFLSCARCHAGKHKTIPACQSCHGSPHPEEVHAKFPQCGECHGAAHDLSPTAVSHKRVRKRGDILIEEIRE